MKKLIFIAAAAVAMAACSQSSIVTDNLPISFAPNALSTKALILPDSDSPEQLAFPTSESFNVYAFADLDGTGTAYSTNYTTPLMDDVNISYQSGDWKATAGTYLWPVTGTVDFYAYYPQSLNAQFISDENPKGIKFTDVELGNTIGSQIDPLMASVMSQVAASKPKVSLVFKHLTSQIAVTAVDATSTASLQGKISIKNVVFKNMKIKGDYRDGTTTGKGEWTNISTLNDFTSFSGSEVLETTPSYLSGGAFSAAIDNSSAFVVIPEDILNGTAEDQVIDVTYSIAAYSINGFDYPATGNMTVSIPLYGKVSANKFQNGKRYIFHIGISLDGANNEIMFSPLVEGWETENIDGITIDAVNAALL